MSLNKKRVTSLSKRRLPKRCEMCLENRGVIKNLKICRKCFYENTYMTSYSP